MPAKNRVLVDFWVPKGTPTLLKIKEGFTIRGSWKTSWETSENPRIKKDIPGCRVAAKNRFFVNSWVPEVTPKLLKINEVCRVRVLGRGSG